MVQGDGIVFVRVSGHDESVFGEEEIVCVCAVGDVDF